MVSEWFSFKTSPGHPPTTKKRAGEGEETSDRAGSCEAPQRCKRVYTDRAREVIKIYT